VVDALQGWAFASHCRHVLISCQQANLAAYPARRRMPCILSDWCHVGRASRPADLPQKPSKLWQNRLAGPLARWLRPRRKLHIEHRGNMAMLTQNQQALLSVRDVAKQLGISEKTVRREIDAGNLFVIRLGPSGRRIGIHPAEISRYLAVRTPGHPLSILVLSKQRLTPSSGTRSHTIRNG